MSIKAMLDNKYPLSSDKILNIPKTEENTRQIIKWLMKQIQKGHVNNTGKNTVFLKYEDCLIMYKSTGAKHLKKCFSRWKRKTL